MKKLMSKIFIRYLIIFVLLLGKFGIGLSFTEKNNVHFYFVQITDTHFDHYDHYDRTSKIVEHINNLPMKIECVVHTGDITSDKIDDKDTLSTGLSILWKLRPPIHYIPGNHDILPKKLEKTLHIYRKNIGKLCTQAEYKDVVFIFIYTEPLAKEVVIEGYKPLELLKRVLEKTRNKPVIIFHHTPSVEDFYLNKMHKGWKKEIRNRWEKLINSYNVKAVIAGHFHRDEQHWLGNVPLYVSSSIAGYWGRQGSFRIYEYKNGRIGYRTQYLE